MADIEIYRGNPDMTIAVLNNSDFAYNSTAVTTSAYSVSMVSFTCPCCGTHYRASDPGFIPNCHNCGAIMRKGD